MGLKLTKEDAVHVFLSSIWTVYKY